jgi:hypothetical protein
VAKDLGLCEATLRYHGQGRGKDGTLTSLDERSELGHLREENRVLRMERDFLKAAAFFKEQVKFALIKAEKANFPIGFMCRQLSVSRSGYYAWRDRKLSPRMLEAAQLGREVVAAFCNSKRRYGSPRIWRELKAQGRCTSRKRIARLMQVQGLVARRRRRFCRTTDSPSSRSRTICRSQFEVHLIASGSPILPILRPGRVGCTSLPSLISIRAPLSGGRQARIDTELVCGFIMAIRWRRPAPGLIHHSDRGTVCELRLLSSARCSRHRL